MSRLSALFLPRVCVLPDSSEVTGDSFMSRTEKTIQLNKHITGIRRSRAITTFALTCALVGLSLCTSQEQIQVRTEPAFRKAAQKVPVELESLMEKATIAANSHRAGALAPLSISEYTGEFEWINGTEQV